MKLTGTNRPITYTTHHPGQTGSKAFATTGRYKETRLLASTMWFPNNKPVVREPNKLNTTPHVVTTRFPARELPSQGARVRSKGYGGHSVGETPGPIPNPEAKTHSADGTAPGRVWESRSPPDNHYSQAPTHSVGACAI